VTSSAARTNGWNPLFGFTGLSLGGIGLNEVDSLAILALLSALLVVAGARFSNKILGLGILLSMTLAVSLLGFLIVGLAVLLYVGSFVVVRSYFSGRMRGARSREGGSV
jgi:hypothetical protein